MSDLSALSDEAFGHWCRSRHLTNRRVARQVWQECRRRAVTLIDQEKKATLSEIDTLIDGYLSERQRLEVEIQRLKESTKESYNEGFEAGVNHYVRTGPESIEAAKEER